MAISAKTVTDTLRNDYVAKLLDFFGEDAVQTASGTLYIPCVDCNGDDRWVKISVIVPKDASEVNGTDGYSLAEEYKATVAERAERAEKARLAKEEKLAKAKAKTSKTQSKD